MLEKKNSEMMQLKPEMFFWKKKKESVLMFHWCEAAVCAKLGNLFQHGAITEQKHLALWSSAVGGRDHPSPFIRITGSSHMISSSVLCRAHRCSLSSQKREEPCFFYSSNINQFYRLTKTVPLSIMEFVGEAFMEQSNTSIIMIISKNIEALGAHGSRLCG